MIIKEYGKYIVYCDGCDETLIESVSWKEAVEAVKQNDCKNSGTIFDTWDYVKLEKAIEVVKE